MLNLLDFKQPSDNKLVFLFDKKIRKGHAIFKKDVPGYIEINTDEFCSYERTELKANSGRLEIDIPALIDAKANEYSIILVLELKQELLARIMSTVESGSLSADCKTYYLEVIRQPATWLKSTFGFDRPKGYSILGRRTINVSTTIQRGNLQFVEFNAAPNITAIANQEVGSLSTQVVGIPELFVASKIIKTLWEGEMQDAPTYKSYADFFQQPFEQKLQQIHRGEFPVSCQGMRDMFLHAALGFPALRVRAVNAHNYTPQFEDLIAYAHATAEVFVECQNKWVLTDPWTGFVLTNQEGELLSAEDLVGYGGRVVVLPLIEQIVQSHMGSSGVVSKITRRPIETEINTYTFTQGGHIPGYKTYFHHLEYIHAKLKET